MSWSRSSSAAARLAHAVAGGPTPPPRPGGLDVLLAVLVGAAVVPVTILVDHGGERHGADGWWIFLLSAACLPVAAARTAPLSSTLALVATCLAGIAAGSAMVGPIVLTLVMVRVTTSRVDVPRSRFLGVLAGIVVAYVALLHADHDRLPAVVSGFAIGLLPALSGGKLRAERVQARDARDLARSVQELRDRDVQRAVEQERMRVARDVHDITGHHLSAIALQAGGAQLTTTDPVVRRALANIHELARTALDQTRQALGVLRDDPDPVAVDPVPRLADVEDLLDVARSAGAEVVLRTEGRSTELSESLEVCAYRVIQESITNVIRHSSAGSVGVLLHYGDDALTIVVHDDGGGSAPTATPGTGLIGMRERVASAGGRLSAGPRAGGGWAVNAELPLRGAS